MSNRGRSTAGSTGTHPDSHANELLIAILTDAAERELESWATVALHERAFWGIILYRTWTQLTLAERAELGALSQTKARKRI